ncbi:dipeptide ABC transporter ATP-binding protein [Mesorhizobium retamae]|uniref:ABC transporter ATP-binding protein n=1 Tax=Mesorhizobium retamae TaxID=2912854 RepID=A0ABS9QMT2_9HYPH|nr:ABC transporter ATP-binding protein [Mesorhizobium sp. IRAMC:0171]MCG7508759.1 ABC transporter ATP-binding protein [Mesorhizobium sp. IRAMC:0171]
MTEKPLLDIKALRIRVGAVDILKGVDLTLRPGRLAALVGESGSGKTMLARAILKLLPPGVRISGGDITLAGEAIVPASDRKMRTLRGPVAGMVFQEPMVSLNPAMTIGAQLAEALRRHTDLSRDEIRTRAIEMLRRVRIADPESCLTSYPHQFSGGMRQRIMLASVMLLRPKLLIADEPTTALDTLSQREVLDIMVQLARDAGTAVLLITHNLGLVARYTSEMTVLRNGVLIESGPTADLIAGAKDPYTRELVAAARRAESLAEPCDAEAGRLISADNVAVRYRGRSDTAVSGVSLAISRGETVALVGGSGSGKTSLGRALIGLAPLERGSVSFLGERLSAETNQIGRTMRLACQMVFQDPYSSLDPHRRIGTIIAEPLRHAQDLSNDQKRQRVEEVMRDVGLTGLDRRYPHELSGGQRQRVAIARAIVRHPAFVVADEPVSALDMTIQAQVLALIASLQKRYGFACLFISHDLSAVRQIAHRIIVMDSGKVVEEGPTRRILDAPEHAYTRSLIEAAPGIDVPARPVASRQLERTVP